jgi:hypothetical protein
MSQQYGIEIKCVGMRVRERSIAQFVREFVADGAGSRETKRIAKEEANA